MDKNVKIIEKALKEGRGVLSEHESKELLSQYKIPVAREMVVKTEGELIKAATDIGYPLVMKGCSPDLTHKTEQGLVKVDLRNDEEARAAYQEIMNSMQEQQKAVLVQELVRGSRELMVGMTRDAQFGPCVMFGLGGIFTEILKDISFRVAPIEKRDAKEMMQEIKGHKILENVRGMPAADLEELSEILIRVGEIGLDNEAIKEIDVNPLILSGSQPVAVDALVVLSPKS
ncbi:MAG: carboxylate--amine ligase [Nitrospira bacterium SG8_3]|nr:MAG: carboxylate--amine ligase [Nitrospira bacterium SG8_3]